MDLEIDGRDNVDMGDGLYVDVKWFLRDSSFVHRHVVAIDDVALYCGSDPNEARSVLEHPALHFDPADADKRRRFQKRLRELESATQ